MYEYYFVVMYTDSTGDIAHMGICYTLNYKLDSKENMVKITQKLRDEGYLNPVITFFKLLNERKCE